MPVKIQPAIATTGPTLTFVPVSVAGGAAAGTTVGSVTTTMVGTTLTYYALGSVLTVSSSGLVTTVGTVPSSGNLVDKIVVDNGTNIVGLDVSVPITASVALSYVTPFVASIAQDAAVGTTAFDFTSSLPSGATLTAVSPADSTLTIDPSTSAKLLVGTKARAVGARNFSVTYTASSGSTEQTRLQLLVTPPAAQKDLLNTASVAGYVDTNGYAYDAGKAGASFRKGAAVGTVVGYVINKATTRLYPQATTYYVIKTGTANVIRLASTAALATAGTNITLTDNGQGIQYINVDGVSVTYTADYTTGNLTIDPTTYALINTGDACTVDGVAAGSTVPRSPSPLAGGTNFRLSYNPSSLFAVSSNGTVSLAVSPTATGTYTMNLRIFPQGTVGLIVPITFTCLAQPTFPKTSVPRVVGFGHSYMRNHLSNSYTKYGRPRNGNEMFQVQARDPRWDQPVYYERENYTNDATGYQAFNGCITCFSGGTTPQLAAMMQSVIAQQPDIIIVELGANDFPIGVVAATLYATYAALIDALIAALPGTKIICVSVNAWGPIQTAQTYRNVAAMVEFNTRLLGPALAYNGGTFNGTAYPGITSGRPNVNVVDTFTPTANNGINVQSWVYQLQVQYLPTNGAASTFQGVALTWETGSGATFYGSISGNTLSAANVQGVALAVGDTIYGPGVTTCQITAAGSGTGQWTLSGSAQSVAACEMGKTTVSDPTSMVAIGTTTTTAAQNFRMFINANSSKYGAIIDTWPTSNVLVAQLTSTAAITAPTGTNSSSQSIWYVPGGTTQQQVPAGSIAKASNTWVTDNFTSDDNIHPDARTCETIMAGPLYAAIEPFIANSVTNPHLAGTQLLAANQQYFTGTRAALTTDTIVSGYAPTGVSIAHSAASVYQSTYVLDAVTSTASPQTGGSLPTGAQNIKITATAPVGMCNVRDLLLITLPNVTGTVNNTLYPGAWVVWYLELETDDNVGWSEISFTTGLNGGPSDWTALVNTHGIYGHGSGSTRKFFFQTEPYQLPPTATFTGLNTSLSVICNPSRLNGTSAVMSIKQVGCRVVNDPVLTGPSYPTNQSAATYAPYSTLNRTNLVSAFADDFTSLSLYDPNSNPSGTWQTWDVFYTGTKTDTQCRWYPNEGDSQFWVDPTYTGGTYTPFSITTDPSVRDDVTITFTAQPTANTNLYLGGKTITFVSASPTGNQVLIGANTSATATNLNTFINANFTLLRSYAFVSGAVVTVHFTLAQHLTTSADSGANVTFALTSNTGLASTILAIAVDHMPASPSFPLPSATNSRGQAPQFLSGQLNAFPSFSMVYGLVEVRAILPHAIGTWPALWNLPTAAYPNQSVPEGDLLEVRGRQPGCWSATEHAGNGTTSVPIGFQIPLPPDAYTAFHVYQMGVDANWIVFYLDGNEVGRMENITPISSSSQTIPNVGTQIISSSTPYYPILSMTVTANDNDLGGDATRITSPLPIFYIDYIKCWTGYAAAS